MLQYVSGVQQIDSTILYISLCPTWEVWSLPATTQHDCGIAVCVPYAALLMSATYLFHNWMLVRLIPFIPVTWPIN